MVVAVASALATAEVPAGAIFIPLVQNPNLTAYYAELAVGTPPQKLYLIIDTGGPACSFRAKSNLHVLEVTSLAMRLGLSIIQLLHVSFL